MRWSVFSSFPAAAARSLRSHFRRLGVRKKQDDSEFGVTLAVHEVDDTNVKRARLLTFYANGGEIRLVI